MVLAITEKEMTLFDGVTLLERTVLTKDSDKYITCSVQDKNDGRISTYPVFMSSLGKTVEEFVSEVQRINLLK